MKIAIIGSGTAGLVCALILKKTYPTFQIDIVHSPDQDIIGVGEGSTEHWRQFMEYVGITNSEIIKECDATFKTGIYFQNWSAQPYLHTIEGNYTNKHLERLIDYEYLISKKIEPLSLALSTSYKNILPYTENGYDIINNPPISQYHFDTYKLNNFLSEKCKQFGICFFNDHIEYVAKNTSGKIKSLTGKRKHYNYDFYVDCTGFKKILHTSFDPTWVSLRDYLHLDSAVVFPTSRTGNIIPMYTKATALNNGWMFTIPTYTRYGNGYIFDSSTVTEDKAIDEVRNYLQHDIDVKKTIKFDPGYLKSPWIENCVAIGLSSNFVEPLEATSIGISIQQSFMLSSHLQGYSLESINQYNKIFNQIMTNTRDFLFLHYMNKKVRKISSEFWNKIDTIKPPQSLESIIQIAKNRLPFDSDINCTNYELFGSANFSLVLYALGHIDSDKIQANFCRLSGPVKNSISNNHKELKQSIDNGCFISHKTALDIIRDVNFY